MMKRYYAAFLAPRPLKGFWIAYQDLACSKGFVVYPGKERYPIRDDVWVLPIEDLHLITEGFVSPPLRGGD